VSSPSSNPATCSCLFRKNLSLSLNFRPNHDCPTRSLRLYQLRVLFGFEPSVASVLRSTILPDSPWSTVPPLSDMTMNLASQCFTPCYLILSDGMRTTVIEKDLLDASIRTSSSFIVHTNHDTNQPSEHTAHTHNQKKKSPAIGLDSWIEESENRRECIQKKWNSLKRRHEKEQAEGKKDDDDLPAVREETLKGWVRAFPIMNECSHFGCIMAPQTGTIRFLERGSEKFFELSEDEE